MDNIAKSLKDKLAKKITGNLPEEDMPTGVQEPTEVKTKVGKKVEYPVITIAFKNNERPEVSIENWQKMNMTSLQKVEKVIAVKLHQLRLAAIRDRDREKMASDVA